MSEDARDPRSERDNQPEHTIDESDLREPAEHVEEIGPEDETPEETMDRLQAAGYDRMDEGDFESAVTAESDQPTWLDEHSRERSNVANTEEDPEERGERED